MPNAKLDSFFVQSAYCPEGKNKIDYYDTAITGFILEVRSSGSKTYSLRYRDSYGRQRQFKIGNAADISTDKARKEALKLKSRTVVGDNPAEARQAKRAVPTIEAFSKDYLDYVRTYKRSHGNDERALRNHVLPRYGRMRLDELQQAEIAAWFKAEVDAGYTPATVNGWHVVLSHMYRMAKQWKVPGAEADPMIGIKHFEANNARERYLSADEIRAVLEAIEDSENPQLKHIIPLLLLTGVRKQELLKAQWKDFDLERRQWRIPNTKSGRARHVPLSKAALDVLDGLPRWDECPWLVPNPSTRKPYKDIFHCWNNARKKAGLEDVHVHDLRHTAASNMINAGQSLYVVGQVLGHARATTTARYSHVTQDTLLAAVDAGSGWAQAAT